MNRNLPLLAGGALLLSLGLSRSASAAPLEDSTTEQVNSMVIDWSRFSPLKVRPVSWAWYAPDEKALPLWSYPDLSKEFWPNHPNVSLWKSIGTYGLPTGYVLHYCTEDNFEGACFTETTEDNWFSSDYLNWWGLYQPMPGSLEVHKPEWRQLFSSMSWAGSWPYNTEPAGAMAELVQGLAHDSSNWYIAKRHGIFKVPVSADLQDESNYLWTDKTGVDPDVAEGRDHLGDIDYYAGRIFAPLDMHHYEPGNPAPRLLIYDSNLNLLEYKDFPSLQLSSGWVAVNPVNGLLYSTDKNGLVYVYDWRAPGSTLKYLYTVQLEEIGGGMGQGAAFSPSGHLYFASENDYGSYITVFEITGTTGVKKYQRPDAPLYPIMEGVDIWDMNNVAGKHPSLKGQIHVMGLVAQGDDDNWYILHYSVNDPSRL